MDRNLLRTAVNRGGPRAGRGHSFFLLGTGFAGKLPSGAYRVTEGYRNYNIAYIAVQGRPLRKSPTMP